MRIFISAAVVGVVLLLTCAAAAAQEAKDTPEPDKDVARLITQLGDKNKDVRNAAVEALGKPGDARAAAPLVASLREHAADGDICDYAGNFVAPALVKIGAPAIAPCIAALSPVQVDKYDPAKDDTANLRRSLVMILGMIKDKPANPAAPEEWRKSVPALIAALQDADWHTRYLAARSLGQLGDAKAVTPLIAVLTDADSRVRKLAARALGQLKDKAAVDPLIAALKDDDKDVRQEAEKALAAVVGSDLGVDPEAWHKWEQAQDKKE